MDVNHTPTAAVVVVGTDRDAAATAALLSDENTIVAHRAWPSDAGDGAEPWPRPDVVVFDGSGDDAPRRIRHLRKRWPTIGVVVTNARDDAEVSGLLDAGADDAVVRGSPLLGPRLHALTRRARTLNAGTRVAVGDIVFDREARRVWCAGREVQMTPREISVLDCMFWNAPRPVGMITLADFVWGDGEDNAASRRSVVEVYIGYLRRKLASSRSVMIRTVRGVGYQFDPRH